jgi:AcrR family transcriptional regulator
MGRKSLAVGRRGQILRAAASLFVRKGYLNTSVRDIAGALGMNVATLYHYAGSKASILSLFQEYTTDHLKQMHGKILEEAAGMAPADALSYAIGKYMAWVDDYQDITVFWYQEAKNMTPEQLRNLAGQEEYTVDVFMELLGRGTGNGDFRVGDLRMAANNIVVLCDMWAFRRWMLKKHYTFDEFVRHQTELILAQVVRPGGAGRVKSKTRRPGQ